MLTVTAAAQSQVADYFQDKPLQPLRIFLHAGGCAGPSIALAVDEKKEGDTAFEFGGVTYVAEDEFLKAAQPISIDFKEHGFVIDSKMDLGGGGCSGCGSSSSCCTT